MAEEQEARRDERRLVMLLTKAEHAGLTRDALEELLTVSKIPKGAPAFLKRERRIAK